MAESNDLSLLSGPSPKRRSDQSQNGDEKWRHRGNDDDLTNRVKDCIFNPDGVFGIHRILADSLLTESELRAIARQQRLEASVFSDGFAAVADSGVQPFPRSAGVEFVRTVRSGELPKCFREVQCRCVPG